MRYIGVAGRQGCARLPGAKAGAVALGESQCVYFLQLQPGLIEPELFLLAALHVKLLSTPQSDPLLLLHARQACCIPSSNSADGCYAVVSALATGAKHDDAHAASAAAHPVRQRGL